MPSVDGSVWNPVRIYQSICAFANDIDNLGGGYILVGVKEDNGKVVRPVCGLTEEELEDIQKKTTTQIVPILSATAFEKVT